MHSGSICKRIAKRPFLNLRPIAPVGFCRSHNHETFPPCFYVGRTPCCDRDHRHACGPASAGRAVSPRGGPPGAVHEQPQADRPRPAELPRGPSATARGLAMQQQRCRGGKRLGLVIADPALCRGSRDLQEHRYQDPNRLGIVSGARHGHSRLPLPVGCGRWQADVQSGFAQWR